MRIVRAVAEAAHGAAQEYAEWAARETGMGVVAHKKQKNELSAHPLVDFYENMDLVNPRVDTERKMVEPVSYTHLDVYKRQGYRTTIT